MDEQFDKKLTSRISEVFENYEHPPADESWMKLREKFPAQQPRGIVAWMWWSSAAAILLVFFGVGLWLHKANGPDNALVVKPAVKTKPVTDTALQNGIIKHQSLAVNPPADPNSIAAKATGRTKHIGSGYPVVIKTPFAPLPVDAPVSYSSTRNNKAIVTANNNPVPVDNTNPRSLSDPAAGQMAKTAPVNGVTTPQVITNNAPVIANNQPVAPEKVNSFAVKPQPKSITQLLEDEKHQSAARSDIQSKKDDRKVSFGVYAATYFNYAEGSKNQVNAGAGFTSDIKLSKNLKLSTGLALAQNSFSYNNNPPPTNGVALVAAAPAIKQQSLFGTAAAVPQFRNYNASLVGLDIPVNIKYEFNPEKSSTYISAGLSSGTFIDEKYTYTYAYSNVDARANVISTETDNETARKSFNSFYFGKMLNVSFGVGVPVGKNNSLIFEPFLKYPLGGLGTQQINFGSGGINLKFNFKPSKK